ncbi:hypothetical protein D7Z54_32700 [Salibacterium salarium]|uniref:Uncharacterized protein n=1 Tax=Salibacterium salarium TaxID=284579 RepID=A0A428MSN9_9BACI|nr:hypothetical protein [Salibacterium salarium]RSL29167.1 hypothetical protein D7Z54_32700 [Salibacterium salarium]
MISFRWDEEFGRVISNQEDKKIKRILEIKKEQGQKTKSETIRKMLIQEGYIKENEDVTEVKSSGMQKSMEGALRELGIEDILLTLADRLNTVPTKEEVLKLSDNEGTIAELKAEIEQEKKKNEQLKQMGSENEALRKENAELKSRLETITKEYEDMKEDYKDVAMKKRPLFSFGSTSK